VAARSGHTATLLPDGKVLLVGGTRREGSRSTADLVETVEVFDPVSESFNLLPVEGAPVRRVQHAAFLYVRSGEPRLYLVAGEGDVNYSSPRYAVRPDVRAFAFRGDRLTALQPGATDGYGATLEAVEGHTALPLSLQLGNVADAPLRVFVAGARETSSGLDPVAFELRVSPAGLREVTARAPVIPRTHHAAAPLALDYGLLAGGRRGGGEAATRAEVYSVAARRYFLVPAEAFSDGRLDASATFVGDGRIRLVGGFSPSGIALSTSLLYTATL
jgi:predicted GNAT superfamily acetyltransferase